MLYVGRHAKGADFPGCGKIEKRRVQGLLSLFLHITGNESNACGPASVLGSTLALQQTSEQAFEENKTVSSVESRADGAAGRGVKRQVPERTTSTVQYDTASEKKGLAGHQIPATLGHAERTCGGTSMCS